MTHDELVARLRSIVNARVRSDSTKHLTIHEVERLERELYAVTFEAWTSADDELNRGFHRAVDRATWPQRP